MHILYIYKSFLLQASDRCRKASGHFLLSQPVCIYRLLYPEIIAQKSAFLASSASVEMSIFFQKRFGSGLFGGDTQGQGTDLTIGSGSYIDDFEDQLIGAHPGDKVEVKVTFPENYGNDELNGKEATFKVTVNGIYE